MGKHSDEDSCDSDEEKKESSSEGEENDEEKKSSSSESESGSDDDEEKKKSSSEDESSDSSEEEGKRKSSNVESRKDQSPGEFSLNPFSAKNKQKRKVSALEKKKNKMALELKKIEAQERLEREHLNLLTSSSKDQKGSASEARPDPVLSIQDILRASQARNSINSQPSAAAYPVASSEPSAAKVGEAAQAQATPSETKATPSETKATPSEGVLSDVFEPLKRKKRFKKEELSTDLKTIKSREKALEYIIKAMDRGFVKFPQVTLLYGGSHEQFDEDPSRTRQSFGVASGGQVRSPFPADVNLGPFLETAYGGSSGYGLPLKIELWGYHNGSDKHVALISSVSHLNHRGSGKKPHLFVARPGASVDFTEPLVLYDITSSISDNDHPKSLVSTRANVEDIRKEQVGKKKKKTRYVKVPEELRGYISEGHTVYDTYTRVHQIESDHLHDLENRSLFVFILKNKHIKDAEMHQSMKFISHKGGEYVELPHSVVERALENFAAVQKEHANLTGINLNSLEFQIEPLHGSKWCESHGTRYQELSFKGEVQKMLVTQQGALKTEECMMGRQISFTISLSYIPSLKQQAGGYESSMAQASEAPKGQEPSAAPKTEVSQAKPVPDFLASLSKANAT